MNAHSTIGEGQVIIGEKCRIASDVQFIFHRPSTITIGDACVIGPGVKFVCDGGDVAIDDWTTLHDRCLVLSGKGVTIGQHGWFGQHTIIDGTGGITIGNGVRVGMYSQLWSHVAAGEQIEGCTLFGKRPVVIEDDVWLVGSCIVASGITIARRTVALIGSNITRSTEPGVVIAGSPAQPKPTLDFYRPMTPADKWALLEGWLDEIAAEQSLSIEKAADTIRLRGAGGDDEIVFVAGADVADATRSLRPATVCCVEDKSYNKRLTRIELDVLKALAGNKARFYSPRDPKPES